MKDRDTYAGTCGGRSAIEFFRSSIQMYEERENLAKASEALFKKEFHIIDAVRCLPDEVATAHPYMNNIIWCTAKGQVGLLENNGNKPLVRTLIPSTGRISSTDMKVAGGYLYLRRGGVVQAWYYNRCDEKVTKAGILESKTGAIVSFDADEQRCAYAVQSVDDTVQVFVCAYGDKPQQIWKGKDLPHTFKLFDQQLLLSNSHDLLCINFGENGSLKWQSSLSTIGIVHKVFREGSGSRTFALVSSPTGERISQLNVSNGILRDICTVNDCIGPARIQTANAYPTENGSRIIFGGKNKIVGMVDTNRTYGNQYPIPRIETGDMVFTRSSICAILPKIKGMYHAIATDGSVVTLIPRDHNGSNT